MNITKDEARIIGELLKDGKYDICRDAKKFSSTETMNALEHLEKRLTVFGKDSRRNSRHSNDSWTDCMNRFVNKYKKEYE